MRSFLPLLAFAASALAYTVTQPNTSQGWTTSGPNVVAWNQVSTDRANFTIVLVNQQNSPPTSQVLAALVDGSLGQTTVNPPSGGWKAGQAFQVNLVMDSQHLDTILAQSPQFDIALSTSSTFSTPTFTSSVNSPPATTSASATDPNAASPSTTSPANSASSPMGMQAGLFAGIAFLGAFLA